LNKFILTIVDDATRFPEAYALKSCDAENVANALMDMFSRVGVPRGDLLGVDHGPKK
jgi:hypothetical protein